MRMNLLAAAVALALFATGAHAGTVLSDTFDSENGGMTALNYTGFANFNVIAAPGDGVDLVETGDDGIVCAGGSGSCVDLDGAPGPAGIVSKTAYAFDAGDLLTLSFQIAGNQRNSDSNTFFGGFLFSNTTVVSDLSGGGAYNSTAVLPGPYTLAGVTDGGVTSGGSQPFETYTFSLRPLDAGAVRAWIGTNDTGNVGPLLDNVSLSISPAPEPATWATMLLGVGMIGAGQRTARRSNNLALTAA